MEDEAREVGRVIIKGRRRWWWCVRVMLDALNVYTNVNSLSNKAFNFTVQIILPGCIKFVRRNTGYSMQKSKGPSTTRNHIGSNHDLTVIPRFAQPMAAAKMMMAKTTTRISNRQNALPLALFWYLLALLSSISASRVSPATLMTFP